MAIWFTDDYINICPLSLFSQETGLKTYETSTDFVIGASLSLNDHKALVNFMMNSTDIIVHFNRSAISYIPIINDIAISLKLNYTIVGPI